MKSLLLGLLVTFSVQSLAQNAIQYRPVELVKQDPNRGNRAEWDQTGQFCYQAQGTTNVKCATIVQLGEVKVRENGEFSNTFVDQVYISQLSPKARAIAEKYGKLYVRYIGLEGGSRFVAHVFYGKQTTFAFGIVGLLAGKSAARIDSFSFSPGDASGVMIEIAKAALDQGGMSQADYDKIVKGVADDLLVAQEIVTIHLQTNPQPAIPGTPIP